MSISDKAQQVLEYIERRIEDGGFPPSVREVCRDVHIKSTSTAHQYLSELNDAGFIIKGDKLNRAIRLTNSRPTGVPLLGVVTAGQPILAVESIEGYVQVQVPGYTNHELFALRVRGESMINAGILDGDTIVVARTPVARNGEIVVVLVGEEATVKRIYKENGHFRLQPENDTMDPIIVDEVAVLGRVVKLIREF